MTNTIKTPAEMTPREIDTALADLYRREAQAAAKLAAKAIALHDYLGERRRYGRGGRVSFDTTDQAAYDAVKARAAAGEKTDLRHGSKSFAEIKATFDALAAGITKIRDAMRPYDAEYDRRQWSRFFSVPAGHVHSSMSCQTCNHNGRATTFGWNPELSGLTEADAVAKLGPLLCTVCFPTAPVEWTIGRIKRTREQIEADRVAAEAKARVEDPKLIAAPDGLPLRVDGQVIRTVRTAEIEYVSALVWAESSRRRNNNERFIADHEANARRIAEALAHKTGETVEAIAARLAPKVVAKIKRDLD